MLVEPSRIRHTPHHKYMHFFLFSMMTIFSTAW